MEDTWQRPNQSEVENQEKLVGGREATTEPDETTMSSQSPTKLAATNSAENTTTTPENPEAGEEEDQGEKSKQEGSGMPGVSNEVRTMLRYFNRKADLLWFEGVPELQDLVIPQPMAFVQSLRTIISHDVREKLKEGGRLRGDAQKEHDDIYQRGTMSKETFKKIFEKSQESVRVDFSDEEVWKFLIHLGLAFPIAGTEEKILIPSLISDDPKMEKVMREKAGDFGSETLVFQYTLDWNYKSLRSFHDLVQKFRDLEQEAKGSGYNSRLQQKGGEQDSGLCGRGAWKVYFAGPI